MFPELCTLDLAPLANAPINPDNVRRRMTTTVKKAVPVQQRQQQQQQSGQVNNNNVQQPQAPQQQTVLARTVSQWRRWALILLVFVYLILSKLAARSTSAAESNTP